MLLSLYKKKKLSNIQTYRINLVKIKILKTHNKIQLKIEFISFFKFFISVFIFYNKNLEINYYLYIYYQDFNNLTVKN